MCENPRHGSALEHGDAHETEHQEWSRRDFMFKLGLGGAAASFVLGSTPVDAFSRHPLLSALHRSDGDRILVLIQLNGGNDGLNTVVPKTNDSYYNARPSVNIAANQTLSLGNDFGLHPMMNPLMPFWNEGRMGIVQSVGYPDPSLSHFRSTDIWTTASDSNEYLDTGWGGRMFDTSVPDFETNPPEYPLAVQLGGGASLILQGDGGAMGMNIVSESVFERLAAEGKVYDEQDVPDSPHGRELAFARSVSNDSYRYAAAIHEANSGGVNKVEYPDVSLGRNLANVARMIKGGLPTKVYLVSLKGFDTHANQLTRHEELLDTLSKSMRAFHDDLSADGHGSRVMTMTFSEFGRRVSENGSAGTDHGSSAPMFVVGDDVEGGLYGTAPDLGNLDSRGNMPHSTDFRSVYATALSTWLGLPLVDTNSVIGGSFEQIPFVNESTSVSTELPKLPGFGMAMPYPNPARSRVTINFELPSSSEVRLVVYDVAGRSVITGQQANRAAGHHTETVDLHELPSGIYFARLETSHGNLTQRITVAR